MWNKIVSMTVDVLWKLGRFVPYLRDVSFLIMLNSYSKEKCEPEHQQNTKSDTSLDNVYVDNVVFIDREALRSIDESKIDFVFTQNNQSTDVN